MSKKNTAYQNIEITLTNLLILGCCLVIHRYLGNTQALLWICPLLIVINSLRYFMRLQVLKAVDFIIKWRWLIGLAVFVILVAFRIHGSSASAYNQLLYSDQASDTGVLFGVGRVVRTDEYLVQLPYFFSQKYNGYREISYQMSLSGQDMIIGYNSPVLSLTLIGKPFVWGYMLFGNEVGLSWYWCSKTILGLLVAFEACFILTKNKYVSLFGSIFIIYSPAIQWWFSPHMYDVYFWCMAVFTVGYYFFTAKNRLWKVLTTVLAVCVLDGFVIALFPSLQVGVGYVVLALFIACLCRDKDSITFHKKDILRLVIAVIALAVIIGSFVYTARDAIQILSDTVYPGHRVSTGGDQTFSALFTNLNVLFTPFFIPANSNQSELSTFNHVGLLCMMLMPYLWAAHRKKAGKDRWFSIGWTFFAVILVQMEFMFIGMPEWLAKITLLSYVNRMNLVYSFTSALFTVWTIETIARYHKLFDKKVLIALSCVFGALYCIAAMQMPDSDYLLVLPGREYFYIVLAILFTIAALCMVLNRRRFAAALCAAWIVVTSMTVNPVVKGISSITGYDFVQAAVSCNEEEEGTWLAIGGWAEQSLLLANGMQVLNAVNYYPDFEKWELIDPDGTYMNEYNRYAHITINLADQETSIGNPYPDQVFVVLNPQDLEKLGVKYILVNQDVDDLLTKYQVEHEELYEGEGYYIYRLG
ncbi:MAG: DUF7657 domain-containing protein [Oscillospiraceae bacterium]|jgi:hypothetical protein